LTKLLRHVIVEHGIAIPPDAPHCRPCAPALTLKILCQGCWTSSGWWWMRTEVSSSCPSSKLMVRSTFSPYQRAWVCMSFPSSPSPGRSAEPCGWVRKWVCMSFPSSQQLVRSTPSPGQRACVCMSFPSSQLRVRSTPWPGRPADTRWWMRPCVRSSCPPCFLLATSPSPVQWVTKAMKTVAV
jgi:hypothetical protein